MPPVALGIPRTRTPGPPSADDRPASALLVDRYGRVARDLRVSVTEKCSLRCTYCMPAEGLPAIPRRDLLTAEETGRLVGLAVRRLGITDVRFTGGEPLVRKDLPEILRASRAAARPDEPDLRCAMTTNGIGLDRRLDELVDAGLGRVNVSLDTVDRAAFARLTRRDRLPDVLAGVRAAVAAGLPVKLNAVLLPETLAGAGDLLAFALDHGLALRFIEQMPLDADRTWDRSHLLTADDLLAELGRRFALTPVGRPDDPSAPAEEWQVDGGPATVGVIASVTRSFCGACDRTRLTAEGTVRSCLFGDQETDLRALLRSGADDDALADAWRGAMWAKPFAHGSDSPALAADAFAATARTMGAIGG